jgi:hypothetical protein
MLEVMGKKWTKNDDAYVSLYKKVEGKLGINLTIRLVRSGWVGLHFKIPKKPIFIVGCPPYDKQNEPVFLHYLCHAKIDQEGWPDLVFELTYKGNKKGITKNVLGGLESRSADSFCDFYVWNLVAKRLGKKWFTDFVSPKKETTNSWVGFYQKKYKESSKYFPYCNMMDWFAAMHVLSRTIDKKSYETLDRIYEDLIKRKEFKKLVPENTGQKILWARDFYQKMLEKYPTYSELLKNKKEMQRQYRRYLYKFWEGTDLEIKKLEFHRDGFI